MSTQDGAVGGAAGGAWPSNQSNSTSAGSAPDAPEFDFSEQPTVQEKIEEIRDAFPHLWELPISARDGQSLRPECTEVITEHYLETPDDPYAKPRVVEEQLAERPRTWGEVVEAFLESCEDYQHIWARFKKGNGDDAESFNKQLINSWHPKYQQREFARLKGLERQAIGYESCAECTGFFCTRPAEHDTNFEPGKYEDPWTVILTRSASSTPDGEHVPPVEHDRAIQEAWTDGGVYRAFKYAVKDRLGLAPEDVLYHKQAEPHMGGGDATGYGHDHTIIILDAAPLGLESKAETEAVLRAAFEPVIEKHVEVCDWAGEEAHRLDHPDPTKQAVSIKRVGPEEEDVNYPSSYAAKYLGLDEFDSMFERPPAYVLWAATQWATNSQKAVRSDTANHAIDADACTQRYHSGEALQDVRHGEERVEATPNGPHDPRHDYECAHCGSPWEVDQTDAGPVVTDGCGGPAVMESEAAVAERVAGPMVVEDDVPVIDQGEPPPEAGPDTYLICDKCPTLNCQEPEAHDPDVTRAWESATAWASGGESIERTEKRRKIERYLEAHPDADAIEVAAKLMLPPSDDELIEEVRRGEDSSAVVGFEREPGWRLDAIVDPREERCIDCGHEWPAWESRVEGYDGCPRCDSQKVGLKENPASPGGLEMTQLHLPEERTRRTYEAVASAIGGLKDALYTCECGFTCGPTQIIPHVLAEHGLEREPERAGDMVQRAREARGVDDQYPDPEPYPGDVVPEGLLEQIRKETSRERSPPVADGEPADVDQETRIELVRGAVLQLEGERGAPVSEVIAQVTEQGVEESKVRATVDRLLRRGELYAPMSDRVRIT